MNYLQTNIPFINAHVIGQYYLKKMLGSIKIVNIKTQGSFKVIKIFTLQQYKKQGLQVHIYILKTRKQD